MSGFIDAPLGGGGRAVCIKRRALSNCQSVKIITSGHGDDANCYLELFARFVVTERIFKKCVV